MSQVLCADRTEKSQLHNIRWETFVQNVAAGSVPAKAYVSAGYSENGASASANKLLKNPKIQARIAQLRSQMTENVVQRSISERSNRMAIYEDLARRAMLLIEERGKEMADEVAGGASGLLCRDYKGKEADTPIYRTDNGLGTLTLEILKQSAQDCGQWVEKHSSLNMTMHAELAQRLEAARKRLAAAPKLPEIEGETEEKLAAVEAEPVPGASE